MQRERSEKMDGKRKTANVETKRRQLEKLMSKNFSDTKEIVIRY